MKVVLDSPPANEVVLLDTHGRYRETDLVRRVQHMCRKILGAAKNQRKTDLPRRCLEPGKPKGLAGFLKNRAADISAFQNADAVEREDGLGLIELGELTELQEAASSSAANLETMNKKRIEAVSKNLERKQARCSCRLC